MIRLLDEGVMLAIEQRRDHTDPAECVWALTVDAARAFESLPLHGPRGYPSASSMPEPHRSRWEIFAVERDRITDGVIVPTLIRYQADARAITRAQEVRRFWAPENLQRVPVPPQRAIHALWCYALNGRPKRTRDLTGVPESSLKRWRVLCCREIARLIE